MDTAQQDQTFVDDSSAQKDSALLEEASSPPFALSLTDEERTTIDSTIDSMTAHFRRFNVQPERPLFLNEEHMVCEQIDEVIAAGLKELHKHKFDCAGEKLFDRLCRREINGEDDAMRSMGHIVMRLMDSMNYILVIKKSYRGRQFCSNVSEKDARSELKKRKLLRG
jgi:hypothetical protein